MCYPKPGPRCSAHARATLAKAATAYDRAVAERDRTPCPADPCGPDNDQEWARWEAAEADVADARSGYEKALRDYWATPDGIRELEARSIDPATVRRSPHDLLPVVEQLHEARRTRAEQMAALAATRNPVREMANSEVKAELADLIDNRMPAAADDAEALLVEQRRFGAVLDEIEFRRGNGTWRMGRDLPAGDGGPSIRAQMMPFSSHVPA